MTPRGRGRGGHQILYLGKWETGKPGHVFRKPGNIFRKPGNNFGKPGHVFGKTGNVFGKPGNVFGKLEMYWVNRETNSGDQQ